MRIYKKSIAKDVNAKPSTTNKDKNQSKGIWVINLYKEKGKNIGMLNGLKEMESVWNAMLDLLHIKKYRNCIERIFILKLIVKINSFTIKIEKLCIDWSIQKVLFLRPTI